MIFVATLLEASAWAAAYLTLGAISGLEPALYFSVVTFTTVGYGDVVLTPEWRLLGSFEAVNGIIMFGWSTALVIAVVQRVYTSTMSR
jgi:voltage-gated potassium channel Kch